MMKLASTPRLKRLMVFVFILFFMTSISMLFYAQKLLSDVQAERDKLNLPSSTANTVSVIQLKQLNRKESFGKLLQELGIVFLPLNIAAFLIEYLSGKRQADYLLEELPTRLRNPKVMPERPDIRAYVAGAKTQIDIIHTNFSNLLDVRHQLVTLSRGRVRVRLALLNPESDFFRTRYKEVGHASPEAFRLEVASALLQVLDTCGACGIEIRVFDSPPSLFVYRIDDTLIIGFVLAIDRSQRTTHLVFDCQSETIATQQLGRHINTYFASTDGDILSAEEIKQLRAKVKRLVADFAQLEPAHG
jgi:hypothetical protein